MAESSLPFSIESEAALEPGIFKPVSPNPSGLRIAWLLFGISLFVGLYLLFFDFTLPLLFWLAFTLLLLVALAISFSHWLEERTSLILEAEGIQFQSPLRKVMLAWPEIDELWCGKIQGGWRFMVSGKESAFRFQSHVVLRSGSGREVQSGFIKGQEIAGHIYKIAQLGKVERQDEIWIYRKKLES
jgi:hypothetical protein